MELSKLQKECGDAAKRKGFHDDRPTEGAALKAWQSMKLMLIVSELAEAMEEIRKGIPVGLTYYTTEGLEPKPEGFPSELADVVIRALDLAYTEGIDLEQVIKEKLVYNRSRKRLHGKQF